MRTALAFALVLLAGCTANDNGPGALGDRLRECGLVSEGELTYLPFELYAPDSCYRDCLAGASCTQLEESLCGGIDLGILCDQRCAFRCDDDSLISPDQECDGVDNCEGGEDEIGCPPVDTSCVGAIACDGWAQCADGRDELGCEMFVCEDGLEIPIRNRCDGWSRCNDGSDEWDCARVTAICPMP